MIVLSHESALEYYRLAASVDSGTYRELGEIADRWPRRDRLDSSGCSALACLGALGSLERPLHLLLPDKNRVRSPEVAFHRWSARLPSDPFWRVSDDVWVSSPSFTLLQLCSNVFRRDRRTGTSAETMDDRRRLNRSPYSQLAGTIRLTLVAMELMGTYRLAPIRGNTSFGTETLLSANGLHGFVDAHEGHQGIQMLRRVTSHAMPNSYSPMETALALGLTLQRRYGGFQLPQPHLNELLELTGTGGRTVSYRPDLYWPERRLVVEYDSDLFHSADAKRSKLAEDDERSNALTATGRHVMHVTKEQMLDFRKYQVLASQVTRALGRKPAATDREACRQQSKLHHLLLHPY